MYDNYDVKAIYQSLHDYYSSMHGQMMRDERMYRKDFRALSDVPYEVRIFESSTGSNIIDAFRNQIRTDLSLIHISEPTRPY